MPLRRSALDSIADGYKGSSNTSLGKDAMNRVSTSGVFVAFFFQIGINYGELKA
ncbi:MULTISPECIES: hypothetical protein [unclassified Nostoc]|uniref:hypothetical protein n=1 Tax=unclassified Nostoc TaxID=2593658 RepID=UPI001DB09DF9|nr:hypothetical protein [Nostoc sp. JL23]MBN3879006.1 hypothetical protein [Nostoc sp. JL23]